MVDHDNEIMVIAKIVEALHTLDADGIRRVVRWTNDYSNTRIEVLNKRIDVPTANPQQEH